VLSAAWFSSQSVSSSPCSMRATSRGDVRGVCKRSGWNLTTSGRGWAKKRVVLWDEVQMADDLRCEGCCAR
jgi:hypothetical protein